jgi:hypothetical protein
MLMFTSIDKALAALLGAVIYIVQAVFQLDLSWVSAETVEKLIPFITTIFVYLVPNKQVA